MEELKAQLKNLAEDLPMLFGRLKGLVLTSSAVFNRVLLLENQYNDAQRQWLDGLVPKTDADLIANRVTTAVLGLIDDLRPEELVTKAAGAENGTPLHGYHSFTCDRVEQTDLFQQLYYQQKEKRTHFYYIYGLDLQSHKGIFKRIAFDLEGRLQDYLNPNLQSACRTLQIELTFDVSRDMEIYKQNILKSLFAAFQIRVNEYEPLLDKNLGWLQQRSPLLKDLKKDDFICIFVAISQWDWDKEITPAVTRWFISAFCDVPLPEDSPSFLFFFAIIYEEDNAQIEREVEEVVSQSELVKALPELNMVLMKDIGAWFNKYSFIAPSSRDLREMRNRLFGEAPEHYMEDVELTLQKLIDEYNKRFI